MKQRLKVFLTSPYLYTFLIIVLIDQLTKLYAAAEQVQLEIIPNFFYLSYSRNTGAAWSILEGGMPFLALISFSVGAGLGLYFIQKFSTFHWIHKGAITLFLAGTWGNFIDRAFYDDGVIDFLSFHFGSYIFPTFNIADSALTVAVVILIAYALLEEKIVKKA